MEEEILDDFTEPKKSPNRREVDKIILTYTIITVFIYFIYALTLKKILPFRFFNIISSEPLIMAITTIIICFYIVKKLNTVAPFAEKYLFVIWGASAIFYGDLIYRVIFEFIQLENIYPSALWFIVKISMIRSIMAGATCYFIISTIRKENTTLPFLVLVFIFIALYFLLKIVF